MVKALAIMNEEAGRTLDPHLQKVFDALIHELLDENPTGWERLVRNAASFTQIGDRETESVGVIVP